MGIDALSWLSGVLALLWLLRAGLLRAAQTWADADRLPAAAIGYASALVPWPFSAAVWTQLGNVLGDCQAWVQARVCFGIARRLRGDWIEAWLGLGVAALVLDRDSESAHAAFLRAYRLRRGQPLNLPGPAIGPVSGQAGEVPDREQLLHEAEQIDWLRAEGRLVAGAEALAQERRQLAAELPAVTAGPWPALWLEQPGRLAGSALLPVERERIEADFAASGALLSWYDGLLTPQALAALRDFCLASTFWHHAYRQGYLGAHLDDGMSCPLLYQIADELKAALPGIFADTQLVYLWAFKYRQQTPGVALHHDSALINVNFWLTPDEANSDPHSGGICIYPKAPPLEWDLEHYHIGGAAMRRFVAEVEPVCVPYRQNRVVIFNSRLFHATQPADFAPGFLNQRLNITLLFGKQPLRYHPKPALGI